MDEGQLNEIHQTYHTQRREREGEKKKEQITNK